MKLQILALPPLATLAMLAGASSAWAQVPLSVAEPSCVVPTSLHFLADSHLLADESDGEIARIAALIGPGVYDYPYRVEVYRRSQIGDAAETLRLAQQRALRVRHALVAAGAFERRVQPHGIGEVLIPNDPGSDDWVISVVRLDGACLNPPPLTCEDEGGRQVTVGGYDESRGTWDEERTFCYLPPQSQARCARTQTSAEESTASAIRPGS